MENIGEYISRITRLANRNKQLNEQLQDLVGRYEVIQDQNNRYQSLLNEYSMGEADQQTVGRKKMTRYPMVSMMFITIRGFRNLYNHPKATELVDLLDELHMLINDIANKHSLLKMKTIGDSLLFASGIVEKNRTNPINILMAAKEMQEAVKVRSYDLNNRKPFWELGIGVHTGPVTAEVTGKKNNPYNLLGESVNITYRLCRISDTGKISLSAMTFEMVKEFFNINRWGNLPVKYKGAIDVYHLSMIKPELSIDGVGTEPNKDFFIKYGLIQFMDIQEQILDRLEKQLPKSLYYHSVKHTIDVVTEVELIGWAEGLTEEEVLLLKLAGLFHDCGHIISYQNHEFYGSEIAREVLSNYNYSVEQVETICRLIMATKFPPEPKDKLEEVICDSDLDYLGRSDFIPVSDTLYQELKERDMIGTYDEWNKMQLNFIKKHQYFTKTARNLREVNKQSQIERIKGLLQHDHDFVGQKS
ncbi:MAG: HD domain-containing protein [Marinilabiliaceae bacterium]|nr:HD domain-containing protein [Marinilabiliaceae bacterium]